MIKNKALRQGDYIKAYGADWGMYFNGKKWISFECLGCVVAKGLVVSSQRLSTADHPRLLQKIGHNFVEHHDKQIHNQWLAAGKPVSK